jgi:hypothetical protein
MLRMRVENRTTKRIIFDGDVREEAMETAIRMFAPEMCQDILKGSMMDHEERGLEINIMKLEMSDG